ncbi:MAG: family 10 glycosylhydrolase [Verrucomicrobiota bacterium]
MPVAKHVRWIKLHTMFRAIVFILVSVIPAGARQYLLSSERPPPVPREFRAAWIASVHNIDWPSATGLPAAKQQAELVAILDKIAALKMNAVIFQIRPQCDALYASSHEPWSRWLTGKMGVSPGYDPLTFCIREAHARGIEVHAWFNPFRAKCHTDHDASSSHVSRAAPAITKRYGPAIWCDPAEPETRRRALTAILDVTSRYDIDGVHLDDYFYPYPAAGQTFADGRTPTQRRAIIDEFVATLYSSVKRRKPWVRVGISPFGIWRPGVPEGIEAGLDAYEQLASDSRKWLAHGWVDYLAPQLYWRITPAKQSFPALLGWWRQQGSRPVWPGIATSRIDSSEDPGRPASEIINQIALSRRIGKNWNGHIHWSAKALLSNRGGIADHLTDSYAGHAAVPPMPWINPNPPAAPRTAAVWHGASTLVTWHNDPGIERIFIQTRNAGIWKTEAIRNARSGSANIPHADAIAVTTLDRYGNASSPIVLALP